jgi:predicted permease
VKFGGAERFKEKACESWGVSPITDLGADLRFAVRQLPKNPAFSTLAALTLALGIGGTVALFSVVNGLMIRPLPVPDEDRVVTFWSDYNWRGAEFDLVKTVPEHFESVAAFSNNAYTLRTDAGSTLQLATVASVELFDVLQVRPLFGRTFEVGEDRAGAEPVVILSYSIWEREFASDRSIVGQRINLDGTQITVVGVMPEGFYFPTPEMELFMPLDLDPAGSDYANNGWLVLTARLGDTTTDAQVDQDLQAITAVLGENYQYSTRWDKTRDPYVTPLREYLLGDVRPAVLVLFAAVGMLLLMACVNVTALILTKTVDRTREMSVRAALGAGRVRLARQVLTESIVLGLVAGVIGMVLAAALFDVLVASLPLDPAFQQTLSLDWTTLWSAMGLAILTGTLIALAPMRSLLRGDLTGSALRDRSQGEGAAQAGRMQNALVVAEVLLAVVLVTGASLLIRTVGELRSLDPGLDPEGVLTLDLLVSQEETTVDERVLFFNQVIERAEALPGVSAAGYINRLPLRDGGYQGGVNIDGRPDLEGANRPNAMYRPVSPDVFAALGVELIQGRGIQESDLAGGPLVAVINESFARRIWAD